MLSLQNQPEEEESVTSIVANAIILARECANARHESWMKQNMDSPYPVLVKNMRADVPPLSRNTLIDTPQQIPAKPPLRLQKMTEEAAAGKGPRPLTRQNSDPKNPSPLSQSLSLEDLEIEQSQPQTFGNATPITPNLPANEIEFHLNRGYIAAALDTDDMMSDLSDEERNNGEEPARETGSQVAATLTGALSRTFSFVKNKAKPIGTPGPSKAAGPSIPSLPTIPPTPLSYFAPSTLTMSSTNTSVSPLSPSGSFEVGGYETQQYPLGNFENGGFVTKLCHHESSYDQAEVDSKRISGEKVKKIIAKLLKRENSM